MPETLTIIDNRTGKKYEIPIENDTIRAANLRQIKVRDDEFGLLSYDPALMNTAAVKSRITYIDGDKGILEYRGYPIEQLAENSTSYLEVAYLLINGELPTQQQLEAWRADIKRHTFIHENIKKLTEGVDSGRKAHKIPRKIAHPMLVGFGYLFHAVALPIDKKRI